MISQVDVWLDNAMYKDNTVFWETTWQFSIVAYRPKMVAWSWMLMEMSISEK